MLNIEARRKTMLLFHSFSSLAVISEYKNCYLSNSLSSVFSDSVNLSNIVELPNN